MERVTGLVNGEETTAGEAEFYDRLRPLVAAYSRSPRIERVAVVGNQPLESSDERADLIDSADVVFRVNGFRVDAVGTERAVGRRADVVVFNRGVRPTPWFFEGYPERLYLMIEPGRLLWENPKLPEFWPQDLGSVTIPNREVVLPLGAALGADPRAGGQWATTAPSCSGSRHASFPTRTSMPPASPSSTRPRRRPGTMRTATRLQWVPSTASTWSRYCCTAGSTPVESPTTADRARRPYAPDPRLPEPTPARNDVVARHDHPTD